MSKKNIFLTVKRSSLCIQLLTFNKYTYKVEEKKLIHFKRITYFFFQVFAVYSVYKTLYQIALVFKVSLTETESVMVNRKQQS